MKYERCTINDDYDDDDDNDHNYNNDEGYCI